MEKNIIKSLNKKWVFGSYFTILLILSIVVIAFSIYLRDGVIFTPITTLPLVLILSLIFIDLSRQELVEVSLDSRFVKRKLHIIILVSLVTFIALTATITLFILSITISYFMSSLFVIIYIAILLLFLVVVAVLLSNNLIGFEVLLNSKKAIDGYEMKSLFYTSIPLLSLIIGLGLFFRSRGGLAYFFSIGFLIFSLILFLVIIVKELSLMFKSKEATNKVPLIPKSEKKRIFLEIVSLFSIIFFLVFYILALVELYIFDVHNVYPAIKVAMSAFGILTFSLVVLIYAILFVNIIKKS